MTPDQIVLERMFRGVGCFFARCAHVSPGGRAVELWERRHGRAG